MGTEILSKTNRLFWLGRYVERTMIEICLTPENGPNPLENSALYHSLRGD